MVAIDARSGMVSADQSAGFSTGSPGKGPRSFDRIYHNYDRGPITDAATFVNIFNSDQSAVNGPRSRYVLRAMTTPRVAAQLIADMPGALNGAVESVLPLRTSVGPLYLVGAAYNGPERNGPGTQLTSKDHLANGVVIYDNSPKDLGALVDRANSNGYRFVTTLNSDRAFDQVGSALIDVFGWTQPALADLRKTLDERIYTPREERSTFMVTAVHEETGNVGATAQLELLPWELPDGEIFRLGELTELYRFPDAPPGLVAALIGLLGTEFSGANHKKGNYAAFAENNRSRPAGAAAISAGMHSPKLVFIGEHHGQAMEVVPRQVLHHNVGVRDGMPSDGPPMLEGDPPKPFPLRSFDIYHMPADRLDFLAQPDNQRIAQRVLSRV